MWMMCWLRASLWCSTLALSSTALAAADSANGAAVARALADTGLSFAAKGSPEHARDYLCRALIYDEHCADALYELGKIFEADGSATDASRFLNKAIQEFTREDIPANAGKRDDAQRRLQKLNPAGIELRRLLVDYCQELERIAKRSPDSLTLEGVGTRVEALRALDLVTADTVADLRLAHPPELAATSSVPKPGAPATTEKPTPAKRTGKGVPFIPPVNQVPPDVERALKAAGWTSVTGIWKKKAENVYEVTNGKLEADKIDGAIQFVLPKGSDANIKAFVRACHFKKDDEPNKIPPASGYGFEIQDNAFTAYVVDMSGSGDPVRWYTHDFKPGAKDVIAVKIIGDALDLSINGAANGKTTYRATKKAPFMISIEGTAVIESPQAGGK